MRLIKKGATDQTIYFDILDSASTTGGRKTGIAYNASGIKAYYTRAGAAAVQIALATQTAAGAHSGGGWAAVDDTNAPGIYRLDLPDEVCASGVDAAVVTVSGASGMVEASVEIQLSVLDLQDGVRAGLTSLPNAAAEANGGLPTLSAAQASNGTIQANVHRWLTGTPNSLQSGRVDSYLGAVAAGVIAAASFAANALDAVWSTTARTLSAFGFTVATNSDSNVTAIKAKTDNLPASPAAVGSAMTLATDAVNAASLAASAVSEIQSGLSTIDAAGVRSAIGLASANLDSQLDVLPTAAENRAEMDSSSTKLANLDASVSSRGTADPGDAMTLTAAYDAAKTAASAANLAIVDGIVDDILADSAALDLRLPASPAAVGSAMTLTSGERSTLADSIWDEVLSGHSLAGSAGLALSNAGGALDAAATAAAVWGALRATYSGAGTFGEYSRASLERVAGSATVDGLTLTAWFENILAHAAGDVVRSVNTYDYKKQDGVTTAFSFTSSAGGRS